MIQLFYWPTPNGHKITIMLEELGMEYKIMPVNIGKGDQFQPDFLKIAPNNRMPAIIDYDPADGEESLSLFESGCILEYLADKTGRFLPQDSRGKFKTLQWLYWQMGGLGPMLGQNHHFSAYAGEKIPYAIERYVKETSRLYQVIENRLKNAEYLGGEYSIADMAAYPWIVPHERQGQNLEDFPRLKAWFHQIQERPSVVRAYEAAEQVNKPLEMSEEEKRVLFGQCKESLKT